MHATLVRFVSFVLLYVYFRWRGDRTVVTLPCDALWPLAWPLTTRMQSTATADAVCAFGGAGATCATDTCGVSYYVFSLFASGVFQLAVGAFTARHTRDF